MKFSDLKITDRIVDKDHGFFSVVFDNGKELQCCLVSTGSHNEDGYIQGVYISQIDESDSGYDWGVCKDVNEWVVDSELLDWWDVNQFLMAEAQKADIEIV